MIGKTVSHYKILEKLGEGGMGLVYKAEDLKLQRPVALKFLPAHLTADQHARQRFEREAQAAAKLNHPNIVVIYEIGEFENQIYIAMEFVEGQTLDQFLSAGPLAIDQASEFVIAIADALALAHRKGIVHRDVKPGNIMVCSGNDARSARQIKVMDFGLAILKGLSTLTDDGTMVGTLAYMSPEQARGQKVDQRSDIFSLGSVFYEMLTGSPPFIGEYQAAILYGIVNEEPIPLSEKRPGISKDLEQVVAKTLAKEMDERYQNMGELLAKLADYQYKPQTLLEKAGPAKKSIAVIPFEDISPGKQNEYLADGMSEELIMTLSQNRQLRVIARTSVMQYKGQAKDVREIGRELGVSYVLEGSVRRIEDQLRITAQLIDAMDGAHLWADKYDGGMSDIFAFQEQVASQVSGALKVQLGQDKLEMGDVLAHRKLSPRSLKIPGWGILSRLKLQHRAALNVSTHILHVQTTAYEYYLKGKLLQDAPTLQNLDNSVLMLERALQLDHRYAAAYGSLSSAYLWYIDTGLKPDPQYLSKAEEAAQKALSMDPNQSDALYTLANLAMKNAKIVKAVSGFANVLEADPNHRNARLWRAVLIYMSSYLERALQEADQLLAIDPYWPMAHWLHSTIRLHLGMFDAAMAEYEQMVSEVPSKLVWLTLAYLYVGKMEFAWQAAHKVQQLEPEGILWPMAFAFIEGAEGKGKKILDYVDERVRAYGWDFNIATYWVASFYAMASEKDDAFRWLDRAIEIGNRNYRWFEADPNLENLRDDPRFIEVLSKARSKSLNLESLIKENI